MKRQLLAALMVGTAILVGSISAFAGEDADAQIPVIGEDTSGQEFGFVVENSTGKDITGVALRINYGELGDDLLADQGIFADGEKVRLQCTPGEMVNYVPAIYDLRLIYADDTEAVLHTLPMGDAREIQLLLETAEAETEEDGTESAAAAQDVTYIRFTALSLGYEMDTLRRETEILQLGEAFLKADYEAKITYTGGGSSYSSDGGSGGGNSGGGGADGCLTDGILF